MTDYIKIRETIEYEIRVAPEGYEEFDNDSYYADRVNERTLLKEEVGRRHEVDYAIGCDFERELHTLSADGEEVFTSRSHDAVVFEWARLSDTPVPDDVKPLARHNSGFPFLFGDVADPDKSWKVLKENQPAKEI